VKEPLGPFLQHSGYHRLTVGHGGGAAWPADRQRLCGLVIRIGPSRCRCAGLVVVSGRLAGPGEASRGLACLCSGLAEEDLTWL
jgi:hypothetical protein